MGDGVVGSDDLGGGPGAVAREDELELARVVSPGGEERVGGGGERAVVGAAGGVSPGAGIGGEFLPELWRGVEDEEVDVAMGGERLQHLEVGGGQAGEAEDGDARGQVGELGLVAEPLAGFGEALRWGGGGDPLAEVAP